MSFSPDGQRLASASNPKKATAWMIAGDPTTARHMGGFAQVIFSPDGERLVSASSETVKLWFGKLDAAAWEKRRVALLENQAEDAFRDHQWFAAAFHLRQLLKQRPNDRELHARLNYALAELKSQQGNNPK